MYYVIDFCTILVVIFCIIIMFQSPPKGATIPYRPKPSMAPVIFAGGQAYTIQGQFAVPHPDLTKLHQLAIQSSPVIPGHGLTSSISQQALASAMAANTLSVRAGLGGNHQNQTHEMSIPNDLIGCVIGKGGQKISEIR